MKRKLTFLTKMALMAAAIFSQEALSKDSVTVTILYDNTTYVSGATAHWGFSCLIKGLEKTILFDAGASGTILLQNAALLGVSTKSAPIVVVSHNHTDHTAGLSSALGTGSTADVYIGSTFTSGWDPVIAATGASVHRVSDPAILFPDVQTTGEVQGEFVYEQSLIITTDSGLVMIMGCSHPGVLTILDRAKQLLKKDIYLVIGGFHWYLSADDEILAWIAGLKNLGVKKCGATHCTGDNGIALLRQAFGSDFVEMGVGRVITLPAHTITSREETGSRSSAPKTFALDQNYPNPFNPSTEICYQLSTNSVATLTLHDLLGREVAVLVNERKEAGRYSVQWDAASFPSGIYFCRFQAGAFRQTKRMVLLK
jgi:7,8-dihydropterin-6-yl-methyl-4-(beta-D-ribofuranosyl)aminobenzene 5'-phosphate synthase